MKQRTLKSSLLIGCTLAISAVSGLSIANACLHGPRWYTAHGGTTSESRQQAIIFHANGREELILKVDAELSAAEKMPDTLGWVIPLPSVPDAFQIDVDNELFHDARRFHDQTARISSRVFPPYPYHHYYSHSQGRSGSRHYGSGRSPSSIAVEIFNVGPYEIHQITVLGAQAVAELNEWFAANQFDQKDPAQMKFFIERRYTFLCVKVRPEQEGESFGESLSLPPLRISFASDRPYYPLKFSSHQGVFDVDLMIFSEQAIDYNASGEVCRQLGISDNNDRFVDSRVIGFVFGRPRYSRKITANGQRHYHLAKIPRKRTNVYRRNVIVQPSEIESGKLRSFIGKVSTEMNSGPSANWCVNRIIARSVNGKANPISAWNLDIQFEVAPIDDLAIEAIKPGD